MVNTMGKLASFGRFSITIVSASSISLATDHYSHAPRPPEPPNRRHQRGQAVRRPARWFLHATDHRIGKNRTGPDLHEPPSLFSMAPSQATPSKNQSVSPPLAAAQSLNILSRPETLNAISSRRACRMAKSRSAYPFPYEGRFLSSLLLPRPHEDGLSEGLAGLSDAEGTQGYDPARMKTRTSPGSSTGQYSGCSGTSIPSLTE